MDTVLSCLVSGIIASNPTQCDFLFSLARASSSNRYLNSCKIKEIA